MLAYIDRTFRGYGVKAFGEATMSKLTDTQIEEARCYACMVVSERTKLYGRQEKGTAEKMFCRKVERMLAELN